MKHKIYLFICALDQCSKQEYRDVKLFAIRVGLLTYRLTRVRLLASAGLLDGTFLAAFLLVAVSKYFTERPEFKKEHMDLYVIELFYYNLYNFLFMASLVSFSMGVCVCVCLCVCVRAHAYSIFLIIL